MSLDRGAPLFPRLVEPDDRPALFVGARALSYRELAGRVAAHAALLRAHDLEPGARVGVWTEAELECVVALAAHAALGYVSVPLSPTLGSKELAHVLEDAAPALVLGRSEERLARVTDRPTLKLPELGSSEPEERPALAQVDASPALILYTSGTTGAPKGAVLTRGNIASNLDALAEAWAWTVFDTVVHSLPLFHVHGLVLGLFGSLRRGGALRWIPRFDPHEVARALLPGQTLLFAVPTLYHRLAAAAEEEGPGGPIAAGLAAARLLISGSAGLPVREHRRIEAIAGRGVLERYGLTETLINCAVPAALGPRPGSPSPGTVGLPLPGVELKLVDDQRGLLTARDGATLGEIAVRGPHVFAGYLNRPEATAEVLDEEGWLYTGDLATRDADGFIRIAGRRATDLIKSGGFKVGAGEVEAALLEHPSVAEAAVVGLPDEDLGERITAFCVAREGAPRASEAALIDHVAGLLSPHKRPRAVRWVEALPRNAMGKVQKKVLRAEFEDIAR